MLFKYETEVADCIFEKLFNKKTKKNSFFNQFFIPRIVDNDDYDEEKKGEVAEED